MAIWQWAGIVGATCISSFFSIANFEYLGGFGSTDLYFAIAGFAISSSVVLKILAIGIDVVMVAASFAFFGRPHRSDMPPSPNTAGFKKLEVQRVDQTAFATELPSLPSPDHEAVMRWFRTTMKAREGHAVKASAAYMHYAKSGARHLSADRFYKIMRAILPANRVHKRATGVHYVGFALHDPSPGSESGSTRRGASR